MLAKCANPKCENRFRYMREGKLFTFRAMSIADQIGKMFPAAEYWWLCSPCASTLTIRFDPMRGANVELQTKFESGRCAHVPSLYQSGLMESYCNRCGRFVGASRMARPLTIAEEAHCCAPPATASSPTRKKQPHTDRTLHLPLLLGAG
jgi:hypothetical protein